MISSKPRKRTIALLLTLIPLLILPPLILHPRFLNRCAPLIIITAPNHGTQKLLSSSNACNPVSTAQHLWTRHNATVDEALHLVTTTSVALLPSAIQDHALDVRTFLRFATGKQVPIVVLHRRLEDAWEERLGEWDTFRKDMMGFFRETKKMMRVAGVGWNEISFEDLLKDRVYVESHDCYIRNCV